MSNTVGYITYPQQTDPQEMIQLAFQYLQQQIPGWTPAEGNLDTWIIEAFSSEAADINTLATQVPTTIFRYLGAQLFSISPVNEIAATGFVTFYLTDGDGHTVPAGTQLSIADESGNQIAFTTLQDLILSGGSTDGNMQIIAVVPGSAPNDIGALNGPVTLVDPLLFVDHVTQFSVISGGVDAESDGDYLNRLSQELQLITPTPILASDFSALARNVAGVQRAYTLDNSDPSQPGVTVERAVTVYALDADGNNVNSTVQANITTYLESMRETNFEVFTDDPGRQLISVSATITVLQGYDPSDTINRVQTAILNYLDPKTWGILPDDDPNDPITWQNQVWVRFADVSGVIKNVSGVGIVNDVGILAGSGDAQGHRDDIDISATTGKLVALPFTDVSDIVVTVASV
jgi:uncharacterized phage protein gp47/JayE